MTASAQSPVLVQTRYSPTEAKAWLERCLLPLRLSNIVTVAFLAFVGFTAVEGLPTVAAFVWTLFLVTLVGIYATSAIDKKTYTAWLALLSVWVAGLGLYFAVVIILTRVEGDLAATRCQESAILNVYNGNKSECEEQVSIQLFGEFIVLFAFVFAFVGTKLYFAYKGYVHVNVAHEILHTNQQIIEEFNPIPDEDTSPAAESDIDSFDGFDDDASERVRNVLESRGVDLSQFGLLAVSPSINEESHNELASPKPEPVEDARDDSPKDQKRTEKDASVDEKAAHMCGLRGCTRPSPDLKCPTCHNQGLKEPYIYPYFCSQEHFNEAWSEHRQLHRNPEWNSS